jgi:hypothetical protein
MCVVVPVGWGLLVVWVTGLLEKRLGREPREVHPVANDDWVI